MRQNSFGKLWPVSALTLGGGGIGMVWGETTFDECVATAHAAIAAGINLIDLAPSYGDGKAAVKRLFGIEDIEDKYGKRDACQYRAERNEAGQIKYE